MNPLIREPSGATCRSGKGKATEKMIDARKDPMVNWGWFIIRINKGSAKKSFIHEAPIRKPPGRLLLQVGTWQARGVSGQLVKAL